MIRRLWGYLRPHRAKLMAGLACGVLVGPVQASQALVLQKFFKTLHVGGGPEQSRLLLWVCAGVVAIYAVTGILRYGQSIYLAEVAQRVGLAMRREVYAHLQSLSLSFFHRRRTGSLMSALTSDVPKLQDAAMRLKDVVATPVQAVSVLALMFAMNGRLTLFALVAVPVIYLAIQVMTRRLRSISDESQQRLGEVTSVMEETLSAPRIVRAFSAEQREIARFEHVSLRAMAVQIKSVRRNARLGPVVDVIGAFGIALILWFGGNEILQGRQQVGDLIAFVLLASQMANTFSAMGSLLGSGEEMMGAADRLFREVLDVMPEIQDASDAAVLTEVKGHIRFENVDFAYEPGKPALHNINLEIEPGQVVALVGETGAGKSTLADLVPRFYDPTRGAVLIDGHDLRNVTVASLRHHIGIVPQETLLFSGTLRDNIAYGRPDATDEEIEAAARAANAESFIQSLPMRYATLIGERGATLSGGERQRIAIARALLANPRILILDEATSALDASTEALVQEALDTLMRGRTTLVIAHRLSTIINADRIVVLRRGGRIAESGTHAELLTRGGVYAALYESQQRAAELSSVVSEP